jgi:hypothetical protein
LRLPRFTRNDTIQVEIATLRSQWPSLRSPLSMRNNTVTPLWIKLQF